MKNKITKIILLVLVVLVLFLAGIIIYYFNGLGPAILPPTANVNQLLPPENLNATVTVQPAEIKPTVSGPFTLSAALKVAVFAQNITAPRVLKFDTAGNLLVSAMGEGKVYAIKSDGSKVELISGLNNPHGLELKDGYLYIAETDGVSRYLYDLSSLKLGAKQFLFDLPPTGEHITRTLNFGPDNKLYVSVGSSCNVCDESDQRRAAILKFNPTDWTYSIFAKGLRNTVFFLLNPDTNEFWGNDMGRDFLGDNLPPDELNILKEGGNYGWPICYGQKINDRNFDNRVYIRDPCADTIAPIYEYPAHNAPLGMVFINSSQLPKEWQGDLLVALHGSWNRSVPDGYKIVKSKVSGNQILSREDFMTGFLSGNGAIGRPVDLVFDKFGNLYISDDKANVIYKIYE